MSRSSSPTLHLFLSTDDINADGLSHERSLGYNRPVLRKQLIYSSLTQSSIDDVEVHPINTPAVDLLSANIVHEYGFLDYLNTAYDKWIDLWNKKQADQFFAGESTRDTGRYIVIYMCHSAAY
jgi:hypothetical protein